MRYTFSVILFLSALSICAQQERWQQRVEYVMDIDMDVPKHQYSGKQTLTYTNNSPESLTHLFYHLYFNAFQPGSMMDVHSRTIEDPDSKIGSRLKDIKPEDQGWIQVSSLKINGKKADFKTVGTILEVKLANAIAPNSKNVIEMEWTAQIPAQVRRSGWMNAQGVEYTMSQWYPKLCEYDYQGWHSNPYVAREFHGVWGDYKVNITMDSQYMIGGTGILKNPNEIGHGYGDKQIQRQPRKDKLTWEFEALNVHDFAWAADPDFVHDTAKMKNGMVFHFIYQGNGESTENWKELPQYAIKAFEFLNKTYGKYPYSQYTVIEGGDGGMEYPMATIITGNRNLRSLVGVTVHEACHSWFQGTLATNEALYEWIDEGFTSFATSKTMDYLFGSGNNNPHQAAYEGFFALVREGKNEALITHADHYLTNRAYWTSAYSKGEVFLEQLGYVIGIANRDEALKTFFETWKFKHPNPNDFIRIAEMQSGLELDWYIEYFVNSTRTIDYAISEVLGKDGKTFVKLTREGQMPMPIDLLITYRGGEQEMVNIPMVLMRGEKPKEGDSKWTVAEDWPWTNLEYVLELPNHITGIKRIEIDPARRMADIVRSNNVFELEPGVEFLWKH